MKDTPLQWCVHRTEQYMKAFPDKRLAVPNADDVTGYLDKVGSIDGILD